MKISKTLLLCLVCSATTVLAKDAIHPELNDSDEFSLMGALSDMNWHDLKDERWNIYSQATYISSFKDRFSAAYSNLNGTPDSLSAKAEHSFTATFTSYLGLKAWTGAEFYVAPEMISELPLSGLKGIGGSIQNFELQKNGSESATWYLARSIYRQTLSFGGTQSEVKSGPMQLGGRAVDALCLPVARSAYSTYLIKIPMP
ncbi:MAG: hypothetical protein QX198_15670, partial [Methylococcaceae bacterium]